MKSSSSAVASPGEVLQNNNKIPKHLVSITEKVNLTKNQNEVLNIICNTYEQSVSQYLQEALVEAMKYDIEEGNFCDILLDKIVDKKEDAKGKGIKKSTFESSKGDHDYDFVVNEVPAQVKAMIPEFKTVESDDERIRQRIRKLAAGRQIDEKEVEKEIVYLLTNYTGLERQIRYISIITTVIIS